MATSKAQAKAAAKQHLRAAKGFSNKAKVQKAADIDPSQAYDDAAAHAQAARDLLRAARSL